MVRDDVVDVATRYRLDSPGIESQPGRVFSHPSRPALGSTQPIVQCVTGLLASSKTAGGVALIIHPNIAPRLKKEYIYILLLPPLRAFMACYRVNFTLYDHPIFQ